MMRFRRDQLPCLVMDNGIELSLHSLAPLWIFFSLDVVGRFKGIGNWLKCSGVNKVRVVIFDVAFAVSMSW